MVSAAVGKQAAMLTVGLGQTAPGEEHTVVHPQPTALVCPPHTPTWSWIRANRSWDRPATEAAQVPGHSPAPRLRHTHPPVCMAAVYKAQTRVYTHTHTMEYYPVTKRDKILLFAAWRELENTMLSVVSQRKTNMISLICEI